MANKRTFKMWCNVCGKVIRSEDEEHCPHCHTDDIEEYEGQDLEGVDIYGMFDTP